MALTAPTVQWTLEADSFLGQIQSDTNFSKATNPSARHQRRPSTHVAQPLSIFPPKPNPAELHLRPTSVTQQMSQHRLPHYSATNAGPTGQNNTFKQTSSSNTCLSRIPNYSPPNPIRRNNIFEQTSSPNNYFSIGFHATPPPMLASERVHHRNVNLPINGTSLQHKSAMDPQLLSPKPNASEQYLRADIVILQHLGIVSHNTITVALIIKNPPLLWKNLQRLSLSDIPIITAQHHSLSSYSQSYIHPFKWHQ